MDSALVIAPLVVAGLGLFTFLFGLVALLRGRIARGGGGLVVGGTLAILGLGTGAVGVNLYAYQRLTYEVPLAEVTVHAVSPAQKIYRVSVHRLDQETRDQDCLLQGDAWEIGGRFQKWKSWANEIGLNATYTLDQLSNRYFQASEANGKPITACDLTGPQPVINHYLPSGWLDWALAHMKLKERYFGSASFMPMVDGAKYTVIATQFGFNAQAANATAEQASSRQAF